MHLAAQTCSPSQFWRILFDRCLEVSDLGKNAAIAAQKDICANDAIIPAPILMFLVTTPVECHVITGRRLPRQWRDDPPIAVDKTVHKDNTMFLPRDIDHQQKHIGVRWLDFQEGFVDDPFGTPLIDVDLRRHHVVGFADVYAVQDATARMIKLLEPRC